MRLGETRRHWSEAEIDELHRIPTGSGMAGRRKPKEEAWIYGYYLKAVS